MAEYLDENSTGAKTECQKFFVFFSLGISIPQSCTYTWPLLPDWTCWTHWSSVALGEKHQDREGSLNCDLKLQH